MSWLRTLKKKGPKWWALIPHPSTRSANHWSTELPDKRAQRYLTNGNEMNLVHDYRVRENQRRGIRGFVSGTYILWFPLSSFLCSLSLRFAVSCSHSLLLFWFLHMFNHWNSFSLRLYVVCLRVSKTNNQIKSIHNNQTKTYTKTDQSTNQQQKEEEK